MPQQPVLRPLRAQVQVSLRRQVQLRMPLWQQPLRQVPGSQQRALLALRLWAGESFFCLALQPYPPAAGCSQQQVR